MAPSATCLSAAADAEACTELSSDTEWTNNAGQLSSDSDDSACMEPLTGSDHDEYSSTDEYAMEVLPQDLEPTGDPRAAVDDLFVESLRQQTPVQMDGQMEYGETLCGRVLQWLHDLRDAERSEQVLAGFGDIGNFPRFDTPALQHTFWYVCTTGGARLGRQQANGFYATLRAMESACDGQGPVGLRVPKKTLFWKAIRIEKRRTLEALGWRTGPIFIADKSYPLLFRDALNVAQELVRQVAVDKLQWDATAADDADTNINHVWTGPFDSAALFNNLNDIRDTLPEGTKGLGMYGYSDSTILNGRGGTLVAFLFFYGESSGSARAFNCLLAVRTDAVLFETGHIEILRSARFLCSQKCHCAIASAFACSLSSLIHLPQPFPQTQCVCGSSTLGLSASTGERSATYQWCSKGTRPVPGKSLPKRRRSCSSVLCTSFSPAEWTLRTADAL